MLLRCFRPPHSFLIKLCISIIAGCSVLGGLHIFPKREDKKFGSSFHYRVRLCTNCLSHYLSQTKKNQNPLVHLLPLTVLQIWFSCGRLGMRFVGWSEYSFVSIATDVVTRTSYISSSILLLVSFLYFSQIDVPMLFLAYDQVVINGFNGEIYKYY